MAIIQALKALHVIEDLVNENALAGFSGSFVVGYHGMVE